MPDQPTDAVRDVLGRLPDLFDRWDAFAAATTPVAQADTLVEFSNALYHLQGAAERAGLLSDADSPAQS